MQDKSHQQSQHQQSQHQQSQITEDIISNSLDFKDWLQQVQIKGDRAQSASSSVSATMIQPQPTRLWFLTVLKWMRQAIGRLRGYNAIRIEQVDQLTQQSSEMFWGGHCDMPTVNQTMQGSALLIAGWVIGKPSLVTAVQIVVNDTLLQTIPVNIHRGDVVEAFSFLPKSDFGYRSTLNISTLPSQNMLRLEAVFADQQKVAIAVVKFYRY